FYVGLQQTQDFVQSELSFLELTRSVNRTVIPDVHKYVTAICLGLKHYYTGQFFLSPTGRPLLLESVHRGTALFSGYIRSVESAPPGTLTYSDETLLAFCRTATGATLCDILTFSVLPSVFRFFLFKEDFDAFAAFLFPWTAASKCFARVLFLTPQFTGFVHATFAPLVAPIVLNRATTLSDPAGFLAFLGVNWVDFLGLCPSYVKELLTRVESGGGKAREVLAELFWGPLIDSPERFLACRFDDNLPSGFFEPLRAILNSVDGGTPFAELLTSQDFPHRLFVKNS
ncbi:MAG: hypothetical protein LBF87_01170, partial [Treponema sp.]|nr:hypothetical protein [Treponema sp.]